MIVTTANWLFICSANLARSPTAEYLARRMGLFARSCGTGGRGGEHQKYTVTPMTADILNWADVIVCMKMGHRIAVESFEWKIDKSKKKIFVWGLDDVWGKPYHPEMIAIMEPKLMETIQAYEEWLEKKAEPSGKPA